MNRRTFIKRFSSDILISCVAALWPLHSAYAHGRARRRPVIVVDPGHGGIDPGAIGHSGTEEKHVVLDIAHRFGSELAVMSGAAVHMTRETDVFLPLEERVEIARALEAELLVSVHADSAPTPEARGLSVYTLSTTASDQLATAIADHENAVDKVYDVKLQRYDREVASILYDMARRETIQYARAIQTHLIRDLADRTRLLERPGRHANFEVLRSPVVPGILIETGFLSNIYDERELSSPSYRRDLSRTMARALSDSLEVMNLA